MDTLLDRNTDNELVLRRSLKEGVFEFLHQQIVAGKYAPGDWLRQEDIASQLGVSQTPVREALDLLVSVGLAERMPYKGVRVPEPKPEEVADAYVMRLLLEGTAARLAAHNRSAEQLAGLEAVLEQTRRLVTLEDMSTLRQLNKRFHLAIAEASGNFLMGKLYEMTSNLFPDWRLYEYMFRHPELLDTSLSREYDEHRVILEAIADTDAELAARRSLEHIRNLGEELVNFLGIPPDLLAVKEAQVQLLFDK
ncbi:MAG: GntR family transcriptional regulator [Chloroflexota bacterium]